MASLARLGRCGSERVGKATCKLNASRLLARCSVGVFVFSSYFLRILFVFSSCSPPVLLLFSAGAARLTPWRPHWFQGGSSEPMSSFDSTVAAAIQMI